MNTPPPSETLSAANPILPGFFADPDGLYSHQTGRYYLYPTTDGFPGWSGTEFHAFSSADLRSWRDEGVVLALGRDVSWANRHAWAPCAIELETAPGVYEYRLYFTAAQKIGVAMSDSPAGTFRDRGAPLIDFRPDGVHGGQEIDPAVFRDPVSGRGFLYWGNGYLAGAELTDDLLDIRRETIKVFTPPRFREGTSVFHREGRYYFLWSEDDTRSPDYHVRYGTADSPLGPIHCPEDNVILCKRPEADILGTGHCGVLKVEGRDAWALVYHRFSIPLGIYTGDDAGYHRETCLDWLAFSPDGAILPVTPTR